MVDVLDLITGAQDAAVQLLRDHLPADQRQRVWHSPKQDTQPPFHTIGDITSDAIGGKGEQLEDIEVDVHSVYRGTDRRQLLAMMHQVRLAADRRTVVIDGASYRVRWLGAIASTAGRDGITFAGLTTLHFIAEPA